MKDWFIPTQKNRYKPHLLNNIALTVYTFVLLVVNTVGTSFFVTPVQASSITPKSIIELTNQERSKYGLPNLKSNLSLSTAAQLKANNMFKAQYWDHFGPKGETPWQFIKATGYTYVYAGENLAKGFKTSEGVVQAWMASPTHKENVLSGNYKEIGVAVVSGKLLGEDTVLVVQMFGNLTSDVVKTPLIENQQSSQNEKGDTKSIKITQPANNIILNNASFQIEGEAKGVSGDYKVSISDKDEKLGSVETNGKEWTFDKRSDWTEGDHQISASMLIDNVKYSDAIKVKVDSTSPNVLDNSITVTQLDNNYVVKLLVDDTQASANLTLEAKSYPFALKDSYFTATFPVNEMSDNVLVILQDKAGNTKKTDISEYFSKDVAGTKISNLVLGLQGMNMRDTFNKAFVLIILGLLLIEVYFYFKKGLMKHNPGNILTIGVWWTLLAIGLFNGFNGVIN